MEYILHNMHTMPIIKCNTGSEEGKAVFWGSIGNWKLFKSNRKSSFAIIKEKFTISFPKPKGPRFLIKRRVTGFEPISK